MSLSICALDDDESILYTLEAMASTQKWNFKGTTKINECLKWIGEGTVEILLLDYHMPLENGLDVLKRVRAIDPNLTVLILTVEQSPKAAEELFLAGAEDFINKPIRLADFLSRIRLHMQLSRHRRTEQGEWGKGISGKTLDRIVSFLKQSDTPVDIDEVAQECEISYTTAHRYLDHLVKRELVTCTEVFQTGKPGRPSGVYRFVGLRGSSS